MRGRLKYLQPARVLLGLFEKESREGIGNKGGMMSWLEKEVPSLELCKKLKKIGFPQEGGRIFWIITEEDNDKMLALEVNSREPFEWLNRRYGELAIGDLEWKNSYKVIEIIKAPTCRELGEWLPKSIEYEVSGGYRHAYLAITKDIEGNWLVYYYDKARDFILGGKAFKGEQLAFVLAKMLIWLKENGHIDFKKEE